MAINDVADRMIAAYNKETGYTLHKRYYSDNKEMDKYLRSKDYTNDPICFGISWNTFSPETNEYDINIRISSS